MRKFKWLMVSVGIPLVISAMVPAAAASADQCLVTDYQRDGKFLTAKVINPAKPVSGEIDATGCDMGVYFGAGTTGSVIGADVHGALYFGVANIGGQVHVSGSTIRQIGDNPFNGSQRGVGVYFLGDTASGSITGNNVFGYQKGGIVVNYGKATVSNNTVTGLGKVNFIAQNGIQFGWGATGTIANNTVKDNWYGGASWTSAGILLYGVDGVKAVNNEVAGSQVGISVYGTGNKVIANRISNFENDWAIVHDDGDGTKLHANKSE